MVVGGGCSKKNNADDGSLFFFGGKETPFPSPFSLLLSREVFGGLIWICWCRREELG